MSEPILRMWLFEPRWHGWAKWKLERLEPYGNIGYIQTLEEGWMRRPYGSTCELLTAPD